PTDVGHGDVHLHATWQRRGERRAWNSENRMSVRVDRIDAAGAPVLRRCITIEPRRVASGPALRVRNGHVRPTAEARLRLPIDHPPAHGRAKKESSLQLNADGVAGVVRHGILLEVE